MLEKIDKKIDKSYKIFTDCDLNCFLCEYLNVKNINFSFIETNNQIPLIDRILHDIGNKTLFLIVGMKTVKRLVSENSQFHNFQDLVLRGKIKIVFFESFDGVMQIYKTIYNEYGSDDQYNAEVKNFLSEAPFTWWSDCRVGEHLRSNFKNLNDYHLDFSMLGAVTNFHFELLAKKDKPKTNTFFSLTMMTGDRARLHRRILSEKITGKNFTKDAILKFPVKNKVDGNQNDFQDLCNYYGPIFLDKFSEAEKRFIPVIGYYEKTFFELVTETLGALDHDDTFDISEKTIKPILMGHPFMILSTKNFLKNLRDLGFLTFGDLIDESYDDHNNVTDRVRIICQNLDRLNMIESKKLFEKSREIRIHNKNLLMNLYGQRKYQIWKKLDFFFGNYI